MKQMTQIFLEGESPTLKSTLLKSIYKGEKSMLPRQVTLAQPKILKVY